MALTEYIQLETTTSPPIPAGDYMLHQQSKALSIRWPKGGFVWNHPTAIVAEHEGKSERYPIIDVTRIAQIALIAVTILFTLAAAASFTQRRTTKS